MKFPCRGGKTLRGSWTGALLTTPLGSCTYHGCLGQTGAINRTGREDARILPSIPLLAAGSGERSTTPPENTMCRIAHLPPLRSHRGSYALRHVTKSSTDKVGSRSKICLKRLGLICHSVDRGLERDRLSAITFMRHVLNKQASLPSLADLENFP